MNVDRTCDLHIFTLMLSQLDVLVNMLFVITKYIYISKCFSGVLKKM